jgi:large subunit ribosomal protein L47
MARIKYVLNERRLGLIAATAPGLQERAALPTWTDPKGMQKALWNQTPVVDIRVPKAYRHLMVEGGVTHEQSQSQDGEEEPVVSDEEISESEVEGRDEGFGGGKEAEEFVDDVEIGEDGRVHKK